MRMPQEDAGTELNWLALEFVVMHTKKDRDLCKAASRACVFLRNNNCGSSFNKNKIVGLAKN